MRGKGARVCRASLCAPQNTNGFVIALSRIENSPEGSVGLGPLGDLFILPFRKINNKNGKQLELVALTHQFLALGSSVHPGENMTPGQKNTSFFNILLGNRASKWMNCVDLMSFSV